jgi:hypothetical protein
MTWTKTDGLISASNFLGEETLYYINNNEFLIPNYSDEQNLTPDTSIYRIPSIIKCNGGIIEAHNNLVEGYPSWISGQTLDLDGEGGFLVIDTANTYTMASLNMAWSDFADPQGNDFSYLSTKLAATAGVNGAPLGATRWVKNFANPRILTVTSNIPEGVVSPRRAFYESGTAATVKASAVDGNSFIGWKQLPANTILSANNPYTFTINSDMNLSAEYSTITARTVSVTKSGSFSATVSVSPQKDTYFDGDEITVTAKTHGINDFLGWSDGNNDLVRHITINGANIVLTANFTEYPYYLSWDFDQLTANNQTFTNLAANHAVDAENAGIMNYTIADTLNTIGTRNNKFTDGELINCVCRRTLVANFAHPDWLYIQFSTAGLSNLKVASKIASDNSIFSTQRMQYSLDGVNYTDFAVDNLTAENFTFNVWRHFEGVLPAEAENKANVYVRWIGDSNSQCLFAENQSAETQQYEYCYIADIIVIDKNFALDVKNVKTDGSYKIYAADSKVFVQAAKAGKAEIFGMLGQKVAEFKVENGLNTFAGLNAGLYIVRIGNEVQKVLVK